MSDEVISLSHCSNSAVVSFNMFHLSALFAVHWLIFKSSPVYLNVPVCPSVPETLNLWGQSRSQVRSSGTGLHSVSTSHRKNISIWKTSDLKIHVTKESIYELQLDTQENPLKLRHVPPVMSCMYLAICLLRLGACLQAMSCPDLSGWTIKRWSLTRHKTSSQGANPTGWLCVIALKRSQWEDSRGLWPRHIWSSKIKVYNVRAVLKKLLCFDSFFSS